ncbi:hypothetical protein F5Y19DRAFT_140053 [Xylariaceae sp. FL1651]|nr:hypothetical protein F5Y19DRAFT_140053 [Xylariaceae sp. FL1651]
MLLLLLLSPPPTLSSQSVVYPVAIPTHAPPRLSHRLRRCYRKSSSSPQPFCLPIRHPRRRPDHPSTAFPSIVLFSIPRFLDPTSLVASPDNSLFSRSSLYQDTHNISYHLDYLIV